jgi:TIR domain
MTGIFVNYRSTDSGWAVLLDRELSARFGPDAVFRASRSIRPGQDFPDRILHELQQSSAMLAIIGAGWSTATDLAGRRRLHDEHDWVRHEIAHAFRTGVPVLPVLADSAPRPVAADLPPDIARLARCQYLRLHHRSDRHDVDHLITEITKYLPEATRNSQRATHPGAGPQAGRRAEASTNAQSWTSRLQST